MSQRCNGKNCKFTEGFDIPHSPDCQFREQPVRGQDNSCGPNNINVLNPGQEDVDALGSAEYMKLLALALHVLDVDEVILSPAAIQECAEIDGVICIANMEDGIHLSVVSRDEAERIAEDERGSLN